MNQKHWLYLLVIGFTVGLSSILGFFLAQQYYGDMEARLQTLETQYVASLKSDQELKLDEIKIYVDKQVEEVKNQYTVAMVIGLPATIAALLASIFLAYEMAAKMARERVEEAFKDPEALLKEKKRILVITPEKGDATWLNQFFLRMGFAQPTYVQVDKLSTLKNKHFDLAIFNNLHSNPVTLSVVEDTLKDFKGAISVFYFGQGVVKIQKLEENGMLSYAGTKSQLYGNLINALKFQKML